jgi:hypothetical protein
LKKIVLSPAADSGPAGFFFDKKSHRSVALWQIDDTAVEFSFG